MKRREDSGGIDVPVPERLMVTHNCEVVNLSGVSSHIPDHGMSELVLKNIFVPMAERLNSY